MLRKDIKLHIKESDPMNLHSETWNMLLANTNILQMIFSGKATAAKYMKESKWTILEKNMPSKSLNSKDLLDRIGKCLNNKLKFTLVLNIKTLSSVSTSLKHLHSTT